MGFHVRISTTFDYAFLMSATAGPMGSYLADVNAIILYAPISMLEQFLEEDPHINCLEDRIEDWTTICKSKLLANFLPHTSDLVMNVLTVERWPSERCIYTSSWVDSTFSKPSSSAVSP